MNTGDYRRFESIYYLVVAAKYDSLQAALRAVELSMGELVAILHRIEWDGATRVFRIHEGKLAFTKDGKVRLATWTQALRDMGIGV